MIVPSWRPAVATIVIPTYNQRPERLAKAVASAKAQTVPVEVIVVDDGSDEPVEIDGLAVIRHEANRGIAAALNTGIRAMHTDWWCWLSSDDWIWQDKVKIQHRETVAAGAFASHHGYTRHCRESPSVDRGYVDPIRWRTLEQQNAHLARNCYVNGSTVMVRRSVFDDVGLFDESFRYGQDWDMWCRIGRKYLWHPVRHSLGIRYEGGNLTEKIAADPALRAARDAEDERIRRTYAA